MNEDKHLTVHFNNGPKVEVTFPTQIKNSMGVLVEAAKTILASDKLTILTEQQMIIVPWTSIKYVESSTVPAIALPFDVIKGARTVESPGRAPV